MGKKAAHLLCLQNLRTGKLSSANTARHSTNKTVTNERCSVPRRNWVQPSALMVQTL